MKRGTSAMEIARITGTSPVPTTATSPMARSSDGKARKISTTVMMSRSITPPKNPASVPKIMPATRAMAATLNPTKSETFTPSSVRLRMSRPILSVPKGCSKDGGCIIARRLVSSGACNGRSGAIAVRNNMGSRMTNASRAFLFAMSLEFRNPATIGWRLRICRPGMFSVSCDMRVLSRSEFHPRIESAVNQIGQEIDRHEQQGVEDDQRLNHLVVTTVDPVDQQVADPGNGKDELDDNGTVQQVAKGQSNHGRNRQGGVLQRVAEQHSEFRPAHRAGGADIILVQDFQHRGSSDPCHRGDLRHRQHQDWQRDPRQK